MALSESERQSAIETAATSPKRVVVDGNTVENHDPSIVAKTLQQTAADTVAKTKRRGLAYTRLRPYRQ